MKRHHYQGILRGSKVSFAPFLLRAIAVWALLASVLSSANPALASAPAEVNPDLITTLEMGGTVHVYRGGVQEPLSVGEALRPGDKIVTGPESYALIALPGLGILHLRENSLIQLPWVRGGVPPTPPPGMPPLVHQTFLELGRLWIQLTCPRVELCMEVETRSAVTSVRGTEFSVATDGTITTVRVYQGVVEVSDLERKSTVAVGAGFQASVTKGLPPTSPVPIDETDAPRVVEVFPGPRDLEISEAKPLSIRFSKAAHPESITSATITVRDQDGGELEGSWVTVAETAIFRPQKPVAAQKKYTVTVRGGPNGVRDWSRNSLPSDYTWSFTLEKPFLPPVLDTSREEQYLREALDYIEKERKNDVTVYLLEATTNKPLSGVSVGYRQTSHDFIIGFDWFLTAKTEEERHLLADITGGEWAMLSQGAGGEVSWATTQPSKGVFDFTKMDREIAAREQLNPGVRVQWVFMFNDLAPTWGSVYSSGIPGYVPFDKLGDEQAFKEYLQLVYDHVYQVVSHYKGKIRHWITQIEVNRPDYSMRALKLTKPPFTLGQAVEIQRVNAKAIRDADPEAVVLLGTSPLSRPSEPDDVTRMDPLTFAELTLKRGVDFDAVSIQAYAFSDYSPAWYYEYIKRFKRLGKPVYIQETGYPSAPPPLSVPWWKGWNIFTQDAQADWYRFLISLTFGSRNAVGISIFTSHDMDWLISQAAAGDTVYNVFSYQALFTTDRRPKKSYFVYKDLLESMTTKGASVTGADGTLAFRGFAGNYIFTITDDGSRYESPVHVAEGVDNPFVFLWDGSRMTRSIAREAQVLRNMVSQKLAEVKSTSLQGEQPRALLKRAEDVYSAALAALDSGKYEAAREQLSKAYRLAISASNAEQEYRKAVGLDLSQAEQWLTWSLAIGRELDASRMKEMLAQAKQALGKGQYERARTLSANILSNTELRLDGSGDSWRGIKPVATKGETPVATPGTSLKELYAVTDQDYLYIMLTVWGEPNKDAAYSFNLDTGSGKASHFVRADIQQARIRDLEKGSWLAESEIVNSWGRVIELRVPLRSLGSPKALRINALSISSYRLSVQAGLSDRLPPTLVAVVSPSEAKAPPPALPPAPAPSPLPTPSPTPPSPATTPTPMAIPTPKPSGGGGLSCSLGTSSGVSGLVDMALILGILLAALGLRRRR